MLNIDQTDEICKSVSETMILEEKDKYIRYGEYHIPEKHKLHLYFSCDYHRDKFIHFV